MRCVRFGVCRKTNKNSNICGTSTLPTAQNSGPQAAMPKRRVARGALNSHGLIGQPKQRRGSRGQRRRQCDEHISRAGGGGWVAVSREKSYSSSSNNQGVADAPRVHAANVSPFTHEQTRFSKDEFLCYTVRRGQLNQVFKMCNTIRILYTLRARVAPIFLISQLVNCCHVL